MAIEDWRKMLPKRLQRGVGVLNTFKEIAVAEVTRKNNIQAELEDLDKQLEDSPMDDLLVAKVAERRTALSIAERGVAHLTVAVRNLEMFFRGQAGRID